MEYSTFVSKWWRWW